MQTGKTQNTLWQILAIILFISCSVQNSNPEEKWSMKMDGTVMQKYETLANYNGVKKADGSYNITISGTAIEPDS